MPKMNVTIPHNLPQDEVIRRLQRLPDDVQREFGDKLAGRVSNIHQEWNGNIGTFGFTAIGNTIEGTITVLADQVKLEGQLPLVALPFKGRIEQTIHERASTLLR